MEPARQIETERQGELWVGVGEEDGSAATVRWAAADLAGPLQTACDALNLSPVAAGALGRCLAAAVLLRRMTVKTPLRLILELSGDGPLGKVLAEVADSGVIRGMVGMPQAEVPDLPNGDLDVGRAIGSGMLKVWRLFERNSYQSQVLLEEGAVSNSIAHFLEQSEQTRAAVALGVLATPGGIASAGGILVETLPDAGDSPDQTFEQRLDSNLALLGSPSRKLSEQGLDGLAASALVGFDRSVLERSSLVYKCQCRRAQIGVHLAELAVTTPAQLDPLRTDRGIEAECVFCGSKYRFSTSEVDPELVN